MEQNKVFFLIDIYFENEKDKIYKKSIKEGGKYIEFLFVIFFVGEKYKDKIEEFLVKIGWDIKVFQIVNQVEMINILKEILLKYNIEI